MSMLEGEIAEIVSDALESANLPIDIVVSRTTAADPDPSTPWIPGTPTTVNYACRGFVDDYRADQIDGSVIQRNDRKVIVLTPSLAITPVPGDSVTARGETLTVINVRADPALATWELQSRL